VTVAETESVLDEGVVAINDEMDIMATRRTVRDVAAKLGFGMTDTVRIVTAASELARNVFKYAGSGTLRWRSLIQGQMEGLELCFEDRGPGIEDVAGAMKDGFTSGDGMGMGLPGAKRLMDEMEISTRTGEGTTVIVRKWRKRQTAGNGVRPVGIPGRGRE
jgi:serine/threonine-protein kinase RsbT